MASTDDSAQGSSAAALELLTQCDTLPRVLVNFGDAVRKVRALTIQTPASAVGPLRDFCHLKTCPGNTPESLRNAGMEQEPLISSSLQFKVEPPLKRNSLSPTGCPRHPLSEAGVVFAAFLHDLPVYLVGAPQSGVFVPEGRHELVTLGHWGALILHLAICGSPPVARPVVVALMDVLQESLKPRKHLRVCHADTDLFGERNKFVVEMDSGHD
mmetsp:Transcript_77515/g.139852  ORF Transcript_77515/g.139852 Transcript_77515/m.139852 type:complete len:213 (+) Transcript_77515:520-1158(+)